MRASKLPLLCISLMVSAISWLLILLSVYWTQDANECWVEIVRSLQQKLTAVGAGTEEVQVHAC